MKRVYSGTALSQPLCTPLPGRLKQEDPRRHGGIERFRSSRHGNDDLFVRLCRQLLRQTVSFVADKKGASCVSGSAS